MKKTAGTSSRAQALPVCLITPTYTVRQKTVLKSSCAVMAMFAMPVAAMSLGIVLARPAAAQSTLGSSNTTAILSSYGTGNPFTIGYGTTIATAPGTGGDGVFGDGSQNWTLTNYGVVSGGSANGIGFGNGGTITNTASLSLNPPGTITGATDGVYIAGSTGILKNSGSVGGTGNDGVEFLAGGTVQNYGYAGISGGANGVSIIGGAGSVYNAGSINGSGSGSTGVAVGDGGTVTNTASASILGSSYGISITGGAGYVANAGAVHGSSGTGVLLSTGSVTNTGSIYGNTAVDVTGAGYVNNSGANAYINGKYAGVAIGGANGTVVNGGIIQVNNYNRIPGQGVYLGNGGTVTNDGGATIIAYGQGINVNGAAGTLLNHGVVMGMGLTDPSGTAAQLTEGGYVYNTGTMFGSLNGVAAFNAPASIVNTGSIYAGQQGVLLDEGGTVTNNAGGYIRGVTNGINIQAAAGSVSNQGTILGGNGIYLGDGGTVSNAGGTILGQYNGVSIKGAPGMVYNSGVIAYGRPAGANPSEILEQVGVYMNDGGSVINSGYIAGQQFGVDIVGFTPAFVTNAASAYIRSSEGIGVFLNGSSNSLDNAGTIYGGGYAGVVLRGGGSVNNQASAVIYGNNIGIASNDGAETVTNAGYIGGGYAGVAMYGGTVSNASGGLITGGHSGIAMATTGTVTNSGTIVDTGTYLNNDDFRNAAITLYGGGTVINNAGGTILATYSNTLVNDFGGIGVFSTLGGASVDNSGLIQGGAGIGLVGGGTITNESGGLINGTFVGAYIAGTYATVINHQGATIEGGELGVALFGPEGPDSTLAQSTTLDNAGAIYGEGFGVVTTGGTLRNESTGLISAGSVGIGAYGSNTSIYNAGAVRATYGIGVETGAGGVTNAAGGVIYGYQNGIVGAGSLGTVNIYNSGTIIGSMANGIYFEHGGNITNAASATIIGSVGIDNAGSYGLSVVNAGSIIGTSGYGITSDAGATVLNQGGATIYGNFVGLNIDDGTASVTNLQNGTITGHVAGAGVFGTLNSVYNAGTILGLTGNGLDMSGGALTNTATGLISGYDDGVAAGGTVQATILNAGSITGGMAGAGISMTGGGTVTNEAGGMINGDVGIDTNGSTSVSIDNSGTISGNTGIYLGSGGNITNRGSGVITGDLNGVYVTHVGATVTNYGLIDASNPNAGTAVQMTAGGSLINQAGGVVTATYYGALISGAAGTITNAGYIFGGGRDGVKLTAGGSVTNSGTIFSNGVAVNGNAALYVNNLASGIIAGQYHAVAAYGSLNSTVVNAGEMTSGDGYAVDMFGTGSVTNAATGFIAGPEGVYIRGQGSVQNAGLILGGDEDGVYLNNGGAVTNTGSILAEYAGVGIYGGSASLSGTVVNSGSIGGNYTGVAAYNAASVQNSGTITGGNRFGVYFYNGGTVTNTGTIAGGVAGIRMYADANTPTSDVVVNGGSIYGGANGVYMYDAGSVQNAGLISGADGSGVYFRNGGSVTNTGTIIGGSYGVDLASNNGAPVSSSVINSGTITGGNFGVYGQGAGLSVQNAGSIDGGDVGVGFSGGLATLTNSGTITGDSEGVSFGSGGTVVNSGMIAGFEGVDITGSGGAVINNELGGTIAGQLTGVRIYSSNYADVTNAGLISGDSASVGYGVIIDDGGAVSNASTGTIAGTSTGVFIYGPGSVQNAGLISGGDYSGVFLFNGGTLNNSGSIDSSGAGVLLGFYAADPGALVSSTLLNSGAITGGSFGVSGYAPSLYVQNAGLISGATGVQIEGGPASIVNSGTVTGTYGNAIELGEGGSLNNSGTIIGATDGFVADAAAGVTNSGVIDGTGTAGIGVLLSAGGPVANLAGGTITGAAGGVVGYQYVTNLTNDGSIGAAGGDAVHLTAGGNVSNGSAGVITSNATGVQLALAGSVSNAGVISGGTYGVNLAGGGTLTNSATGQITGGTDGVNAPVGAVVTNAGMITGTANDGVSLTGGLLDNQAGGVIHGGANGIYAGAGAVVGNAGTISDDGTAGATLGDDVALNNLGGGLIAGVTGIAFTGTGASVIDSGTIASTTGADAVSFDAAGTNSLTLSTGAVIDGNIDGGGSNSSIELTGQGVINNTIANFGAGSSLTVAPGAFWTATGNWTVATVYNDGTFEAGTLNPDPPLYLTGNFVQGSMGTLQVVVTPTMSTQFVVSGTAKVAGTLSYIFTPGTYMPHSYSFLTAKGGVSGTFATVDYTGDVPPVFAVAHTTTLGAAADDLVLTRGAGVPGGPMLVRPADDSIFSGQAEVMAEQAQQASDGLLGHATDAANGDTAAADAACAAAASVPQSGQSTASMSGRIANAMASAFCGAGGWVEATGTEMHVDSSNGAPDYHASSGGFLAGIDKSVDPSGGRLGFAIGYDETNLSDGAGGSGKIGTTRVGLYGAQPLGRFTLAADFMYGHADDKTDRATGIGPAQAKHGSDIVSGAVQVSTGMVYDGFALMPAAGLRIAHVSSANFSENGGGYVPLFAVSGATPDTTSVQPYVKLDLSRSFVTPSYVVITPQASIGYDFEAGDRGRAATETASDGTVFSTTYNRLDTGAANVSAGLSVGKGNWSLFARYSAVLSGNWTAQTAEGGVQVKF